VLVAGIKNESYLRLQSWQQQGKYRENKNGYTSKSLRKKIRDKSI
jgi:hypothetical protein